MGGGGIRPGNNSSEDNPLHGNISNQPEQFNLKKAKQDHYQQGANNPIRDQRSQMKGGGGVSFSNETSNGNPLSNYNPEYLEYFKRQNEQLVAQDPFKKSGRKNQGGMGGGGGNDGGMAKGRGGVAFNM